MLIQGGIVSDQTLANRISLSGAALGNVDCSGRARGAIAMKFEFLPVASGENGVRGVAWRWRNGDTGNESSELFENLLVCIGNARCDGFPDFAESSPRRLETLHREHALRSIVDRLCSNK